MSLTNDSFETAKRKATERLRGWIASIQDEKQSGIPKLRREFKNVFKTIKWLPKNALFEKEFSSETTPNEIDIKVRKNRKDTVEIKKYALSDGWSPISQSKHKCITLFCTINSYIQGYLKMLFNGLLGN